MDSLLAAATHGAAGSVSAPSPGELALAAERQSATLEAQLAAQEARRGQPPSAARRLAAILAQEHAFAEVLRPAGRYPWLLDKHLPVVAPT